MFPGLILAAAVVTVVGLTAPVSESAATPGGPAPAAKRCAPPVEFVVRRVTATGVSCRVARQVVRRWLRAQRCHLRDQKMASSCGIQATGLRWNCAAASEHENVVPVYCTAGLRRIVGFRYLT